MLCFKLLSKTAAAINFYMGSMKGLCFWLFIYGKQRTDCLLSFFYGSLFLWGSECAGDAALITHSRGLNVNITMHNEESFKSHSDLFNVVNKGRVWTAEKSTRDLKNKKDRLEVHFIKDDTWRSCYTGTQMRGSRALYSIDREKGNKQKAEDVLCSLVLLSWSY